MNAISISNYDFSIVFDKIEQYNKENMLSDNDFLKPEEIVANEEIRDFERICQELNNDSTGIIIYQTFN